MRPRHWVYTIPLRLRSLFQRQETDQELNEELSYHIQRKTEEYVSKGMSAADARRAALIEMGGIDKVTEQCRSARRVSALQDFVQDVHYTLRLIRKSPGFAAVVILTLALGIGANTAVFSVVYAVLLRSLPFPYSEKLVGIFQTNEHEAVKERGTSYRDLQALQESGVFTAVAGTTRHNLTLTGAGDPTVVTTVGVTPQMFPVLDIAPLAGRYLLPDDENQGAAPVVVLSEGLWRTRFAANPNVVGRSINLDQRAFTIVGIMPATFRVPIFGPHQEIWIPVSQDPLFSTFIPKPGQHFLGVIGRIHEDSTLLSAQSQADAVSARLASQFPQESAGWRIRLVPLQQAIVQDLRTPLLVLLGAVGFVLLLACVNIANLLLARASSRTREIALRQALGAARTRIIRQLLTESAVLGSIGAILGVALAYGTAQALISLLPSNAPGIETVRVDGWALAFAILIALAAITGFGLAPALLAARSDMQRDLKEGAGQSGSSGGRVRARSFLVGAEIALAMVLVVAAGLLVRSLASMTSIDPGFQTAHLLKAEVSLPRYQYSTPQQWTAFSHTLMERIQAQPGLKESALAVPLPLANPPATVKFSIADHPSAPGMPNTADFVSASPDYFRVMGIPLLRGRIFTAHDSASSPLVTIISDSLARSYFRDENPIGKRLVFSFGPNPPMAREIVGVVAGVRDAGLAKEPGPMMYVPFDQVPFWGGELVVKSSLAPSAIVSSIRQVVASIDKDLPVTDIASMPDVLDESVAQTKFRTWLLGVFGVVALLLAAAGVFGVVSYSVASRTREFGVRAALGASPAAIGKTVLSQGVGLAVMGLGVGMAAAFGLTRFLRGELYGVAPYDPVTFAVSGAVLLGVALLACLIPAWRAMWIDPMITLRCE